MRRSSSPTAAAAPPEAMSRSRQRSRTTRWSARSDLEATTAGSQSASSGYGTPRHSRAPGATAPANTVDHGGGWRRRLRVRRRRPRPPHPRGGSHRARSRPRHVRGAGAVGRHDCERCSRRPPAARSATTPRRARRRGPLAPGSGRACTARRGHVCPARRRRPRHGARQRARAPAAPASPHHDKRAPPTRTEVAMWLHAGCTARRHTAARSVRQQRRRRPHQPEERT